MKRIVFVISVIAISFLFSCSNNNTDEDVKGKIFDYKSQISQIKSKINDLEKQLKDEVDSSKSLLKVKTYTIKHEKFVHHFTASGSVEAVKFANINPQANGQIIKIYVTEGQRVKKGDLLIKLDSRIIESNLQGVKSGFELAKLTYDKQKVLWGKQIGTEIQYLQSKNRVETIAAQIKTLETQLDMSKIIAPFDGIVDVIFQKEGELASPARQIIQFVNLSDLYVNCDVSEDYISRIKKDDKALVTFLALPDIKISTKIYKTGNVINPENRTFNVKFKIKNIEEQIKPNIVAVASMSDYKNDKDILVPSKVVQNDFDGMYLYVAAKENGKFVVKKKYVTVGLSDNHKTEIKEGLIIGEQVITEGYNNVRRGQEIFISK
ncbi:MAG: efflux RND transporter periplasmic adaptor subunit [Bacteroidetes bacterium]|nr:efflux RND transporter periplasmic adaptor subunit [Bacteroidota bacterium]